MQAADDFVSPLILALLDVNAGEGFGEYTAVFLFAILAGIGLKFGSKFWFVIFVLLFLYENSVQPELWQDVISCWYPQAKQAEHLQEGRRVV